MLKYPSKLSLTVKCYIYYRIYDDVASDSLENLPIFLFLWHVNKQTDGIELSMLKSRSVSDFRSESPTSDFDSFSKTSEEVMEEW